MPSERPLGVTDEVEVMITRAGCQHPDGTGKTCTCGKGPWCRTSLHRPMLTMPSECCYCFACGGKDFGFLPIHGQPT